MTMKRAVILASAFALAVAACPFGRAKAEDLTIVTSGGAMEEALRKHFYDPFTKATGIRIRSVAASNTEQWARLKAMASAGQVEWDVIQTIGADALINKNLLVKLDCGKIPNAASQGVPGACSDYGVLRGIGGSSIAYRTDAFPEGRGPSNWAEFFDTAKFPGSRMLSNTGQPFEVIAAALLADGVPPEKLFPFDFDRAFRKLDEIRPHVSVWWRTGDQLQQALRNKEGEMALGWLTRTVPLQLEGVPVAVEYNQGMRGTASWSVVRGAPNEDAAMSFLNFFLGRPDAHLALMQQLNFGVTSPNEKTLDLLSEKERSLLPTTESNWRKMLEVGDHPWVVENKEMITDKWNNWFSQ
ncbi:ABC transporter substrate-binding protein [Rhodoligotrophos defluvii]|uniref:ABC transporter substrate-binding protein n=1 Tax=Rhodoligotrophos defluvii TaxID=2561934 RepID=UPI001484F058|nr:ABC transporter substrate-binding protein [Rhodoligotrophos defluvii]